MRKYRWLILLVGGALILSGCGKKKEKEKPTAEEKKPAPMAEKARPGEKPTPAEPQQLTVASYKALWLKLATCKLTKYGLDTKCPAYKALSAAPRTKKREKDFWKKVRPLAKELITHSSPQVRYWAVSSMGSLVGAGVKKSNFVIEKAKNEKSPLVLKKMVTVVGSSAKRNPAVATFLLAMAEHKEEIVRMEAVGWLASGWSQGVKGALEKVIEKIHKDPSINVRAYACQKAYRHEDDRMIPIYQKYTKDPAKAPDLAKLADSCLRGLFDMWNAYVLMKKPSKKAYKLTLKLVGKKPRSQKWPSWVIMSSFGRAPKETLPDKTKAVPKWYKKKAVIRLMMDVAKDKAYNWLGRSGAVAALAQLGAVKELEKIKKKVSAAKDDTNKKHVLRKIDQVMAKAKAAAAKAK